MGLEDYAGAVPAVIAAVSAFMLFKIYKYAPPENAVQKTRLAVYGAVTLFFISLIFPVQFNKEWITLGWALEALALVWLYGRINHEGLKAWAYALFVLAFARLAINPSALQYHPRETTAIFNWFLYAYGVCAATMFTGAAIWKPAEQKLFGSSVRAVLYTMATILVFLLLNIEIADYFSSGEFITFSFRSSFACDMSYTLGWGIFAMGLLAVGIKKDIKRARIASLCLYAVTALKLFFNDLWQLGLPYRAGAFVGLALLLIAVSYFYQKRVASSKENQ
ncbi:MAG: DUF2339 domain-containing protein [Elusimicrobia bacterium]|nr:DUF2339 domain-containing protein [Elusimicrobiota bacterium]